MTREDAERECKQRNAADGGAPGIHWLVRERAVGDWAAVKVSIPGLSGVGPIGPLKTSTKATPRPDEPPDPRPVHNPLWGGTF